MEKRSALDQAFEQRWKTLLGEWIEFLKFPSISAQPSYDSECSRCAAWLVQWLKGNGFHAWLEPTRSKPLVRAHRDGLPGAPHVLYYGHYDVQPVDPVDAWTTPPFDPVYRNDRLYARGAEDNKGQIWFTLQAMATLIAMGNPMPPIDILLEGEEECGSAGITEWLQAHAGDIRSDILLVTDTNTVPDGRPTLVMGLRGIIHATAVLQGPAYDLHSGVHGGVAPNPATGLARLLTSLHDAQGRIAVEGFHDGILPLSPAEKAETARARFDPEQYRHATGVPPCAGDPDRTPIERAGFLPSIDINGIHAGYSGSGIKTIIPATATVKLTARLAAGQDPDHCLDCLCRHLERQVPKGLTLAITERGIGGKGFRLAPDTPLVQQTLMVLEKLQEGEPARLWEGASIPVVSALQSASGADPVLVGFGDEADRIHAPDESFSREQMRRGFVFAGLWLDAMTRGGQ
ncbi:MAG: hypothetical protein A2498_15930 [Lentisphaerae bacterium RIFOXYC12_FULL_60_16]|nr:MAG: hypothetical protein A2498_15930 [Lentisphaerae bacterium RIFOXYC12_FULL_60_16]